MAFASCSAIHQCIRERIFARGSTLATGTWTGEVSHGTIGALAAEVIADAIVRAATQATASHGLPSARDLGTVPARFRQ